MHLGPRTGHLSDHEFFAVVGLPNVRSPNARWHQLSNRVCFRVRTPSGQHSPGPVMYAVSRNGADFLSASLAVSGSVRQVSVWVESQNPLGSAESVPISYTLSDIGEKVKTGALFSLSEFQVCVTLVSKTAMPSAPDLSPPTCSSQECLINVTQSVRVETLEIQYRSEADAWTSLPDSVRGVLGNLSGLFFLSLKL